MQKFIYRIIKIEKVVDGDTIDVMVDLGFGIYHKVRIRLFGIDTPEIYGRVTEEEKEKGMKAKEFVEKWLESANELYIKTIKDKKGKYGRYLGIVFNEKEEALNEILLNEGLAKVLKFE